MNQITSHSYLGEVERVLTDLELDIDAAKTVHDTGTIYHFVFDELECYIAIPTSVPSAYSNITRVEFAIATVKAEDVGRFLCAFSLDQDAHLCLPMRVIHRPLPDERYSKFLIQFVADVTDLREGALATIIGYGIELAAHYRDDFVGKNLSVTI